MNEDIKITTNEIKKNEDKVIDIDFNSIEREEYYTIKQVSEKLGIGTNKVNHYIFTLNKHSKKQPIIENSSKLTDDDIEILEIFIELREKENMGYDDIAKYILDYIKSGSKTLINKETGGLARPLNQMDTTLIVNGLTKEVSKQTKIIENTLDTKLENLVDLISNNFDESSKKIAQVGLEAMQQTKEDINKDINILRHEIEERDRLNKELIIEGERLRNLRNVEITEKSTSAMNKTKKEYEDKLKELENMSLFQRIFHFKKKKN